MTFQSIHSFYVNVLSENQSENQRHQVTHIYLSNMYSLKPNVKDNKREDMLHLSMLIRSL